jgi:hypothetical protein
LQEILLLPGAGLEMRQFEILGLRGGGLNRSNLVILNEVLVILNEVKDLYITAYKILLLLRLPRFFGVRD